LNAGLTTLVLETFTKVRRNIFAAVKIHALSIFGVKMEVAWPSKTLVSYHITHDPENCDMNFTKIFVS
jgi:hypothetical protein